MNIKNFLLLFAFSLSCVACVSDDPYLYNEKSMRYLEQKDPEKAAKLKAKYSPEQLYINPSSQTQ